MLSRRDLIKLCALGIGSALLPLARLGLGRADGQASSPPVPLFRQPMPIQQPLQPGAVWVRTASGEIPGDFYDLTAKVGLAPILPGFPQTKIWGYNGQFPAPLIRARSGRPVVVRHTNALTTADTGSIELNLATHLHGGNVDGFSDGHPFNEFEAPPSPNNSKVYTYFNNQPAVTMWYHDHGIHHTARNVYHGLAGFYLLSDTYEDGLKLPSGEFDVPVLIQTKFFNADGSLNFPPGDRPETAPGEGTLGDTVVVNGAAWPFMYVKRAQYRFRFLDGSDAREFLLALDNGSPFLQIGTEGGLIPKAVNQSKIHITPAERYEVIIDFSGYAEGTTIELQNLLESGNLRRLLQFRVVGPPVIQAKRFAAGDALMASGLLDSFNDLQAIAQQVRAGRVPSGIVQRRFRFERGNGGFQVNGKFFELDVDDASPQADALELWNFENDSGGWFHPVHLHLLHAGFGFIVVDRNGVPIALGDQEYGWKETVNVGRNNESVRVLMRWPPVPVNPNNPNAPQVAGQRDFRFFQRRYVFHCHNVDHEDHDMMAQVHILPDL